MRPKRPIRSVFLGNPRYLSVYALGVAQAMGAAGAWHRYVSLFDDVDSVRKQFDEMAPDVVWTHMALWPPAGAISVDDVIGILSYWKRRGACVYLHDGDPRERDVHPAIASAFSIALVNRTVVDGAYHGIPAIKWPYAAMPQKQIGEPRTEWMCDLLFAGHDRDDALYGERTNLVRELQMKLGKRMRVVSPGGGDVNNRMLVADVAPSANAVLGYARPEVPGWIDTRVWQFCGSGGVLIHDDAGEFVEPDVHYLKYDRNKAVESVLWCVERAKKEGPKIRERAFAHIQANHTWSHRVEQALAAFFGVR